VKYFRQISACVAVRPFLSELAVVSRSWPAALPRREAAVGHNTTTVIALRRAYTSVVANRPRSDVHESRWTECAQKFRYTSNFLRTFAAERGLELGRARLVRVPAGHRTQPHVDCGDYFLFRDRYHLVLKAIAGSWLRSGDEDITMREGELWWFNNKAAHEGWNPGAEDRIHLVFDALNADGKRMLDHAARVRHARDGDAATPSL
jgi:hypothetical protein